MAEPSAKAALRAQLRAARDGCVLTMGDDARRACETQAAGHLAPFLEGRFCIAGYWSLGAEMSAMPMLEAAAAQGLVTALPHVVDRAGEIRFLRWAPGDPVESGWAGLVQPRAYADEVRPDLILAPLLGFDARLGRIGQGAGHYDRAFAANRQAMRIGIGWSVQQVGSIPRDPWDVPLDAVCTEKGVMMADMQTGVTE
jgi:5-formyltetrahydrofolate cyclo-ligase